MVETKEFGDVVWVYVGLDRWVNTDRMYLGLNKSSSGRNERVWGCCVGLRGVGSVGGR